MTIDEALEMLGPIRAHRQISYPRDGLRVFYQTPVYWLDGRRDVRVGKIIEAAQERKRVGIE